METKGNQFPIPLAFGVHTAPKNAPPHIVRQVDSAAQALEVSILAGHHKLEYIAACVGKSKGYISKLQNGRMPIPARLIGPLCAATGTNLLRQVIELHAAMEQAYCPRNRLAEQLREAA